MRRLHFHLIRAEEELAGARQCIVCLVTLTALSLIAALGCWAGIMTWPLTLLWLGGSLLLTLAALLCALRPHWRDQARRRRRR